MINSEKGQSLFEVVVALAISALIIVALVSLVSNAIQNATFSKNKALAATYSQELTEWLRSQRDSDITAFEARVLIPTWCFSDLTWNHAAACSSTDQIGTTPFTRQATFIITTESGKEVVEADVTVFWFDSQGIHEVTNSTIFSDWRQR